MTGGIGSGKSTALAMFANRGAATLDTDAVVHGLLSDEGFRARVANVLGLQEIPPAEAGRRELAALVFSDPDKLRLLENEIFPRVKHEITSWLDSEAVTSASLAVVEVPLLFEAAMEALFDLVVLISAPEEIRQSRHRGKVDAEEFEQRSSRLIPDNEKSDRCHRRYDNSGSREELERFIDDVFAEATGSGG